MHIYEQPKLGEISKDFIKIYSNIVDRYIFTCVSAQVSSPQNVGSRDWTEIFRLVANVFIC